VATEDTRTLLAELAVKPDNLELRTRAAYALDSDGKTDDAASVLAPLVNVTGHDDDAGLPCLCKRCLPRAGLAAEHGDLKFQRTFAIARTRVLHFWMLVEQQHDRAGVRESVATALRARLKMGTA
jgi:hypothetical protein